jgi:hypothetical protein
MLSVAKNMCEEREQQQCSEDLVGVGKWKGREPGKPRLTFLLSVSPLLYVLQNL